LFASGQEALVRNVSVDGPALRYEFSGIRIGSAEYAGGATGASVIVFEHSASGAVDVCGGSPGTINTNALRLSYEEPFVSAITLAVVRRTGCPWQHRAK
jgi:L-aminopeptidase/D-esterase-like protein